MRVLHVIPSVAARTGGPAIGTIEMVATLQALGQEGTIYATDMATPAAAPDARGGVRPADLPAAAEGVDVRLFPVRRPYRLAYSPALRRALRRNLGAYDIVHIHSLFLYPQYAAYMEARRAGVPFVVSPHGSLDPYLRQRHRLIKRLADILWQRRMLDEASLIHVTTSEEGRLLADFRFRSPLHVGPYGVEAQTFADLPPRSVFRGRYLENTQAAVIVYHGRLAQKKGLDVLISAFATVREGIPDARLVIVGPDDDGLGPKLAAQAARLGVGGAVTLTGMLRGTDLRSALAAADVWAMPSHGENFGIAVVEALAAGLPVVTTPLVNIAAEMAEAGAGVVAELTPEAFSDALLALLRDPARRVAMGGKARAFAGRYDWRLIGEDLAALYREVMASSSVRSSGR